MESMRILLQMRLYRTAPAGDSAKCQAAHSDSGGRALPVVFFRLDLLAVSRPRDIVRARSSKQGSRLNLEIPESQRKESSRCRHASESASEGAPSSWPWPS